MDPQQHLVLNVLIVAAQRLTKSYNINWLNPLKTPPQQVNTKTIKSNNFDPSQLNIGWSILHKTSVQNTCPWQAYITIQYQTNVKLSNVVSTLIKYSYKKMNQINLWIMINMRIIITNWVYIDHSLMSMKIRIIWMLTCNIWLISNWQARITISSSNKILAWLI